MKKITTLFAVVALGVALIGCGSGDSAASEPAATAGTTGTAAATAGTTGTPAATAGTTGE